MHSSMYAYVAGCEVGFLPFTLHCGWQNAFFGFLLLF